MRAHKTEEERRDYMFEVALGHHILERQAAGETSINLKELKTDLMQEFFAYGWAQGKGERRSECKECYTSTEAYP